MAQGKLFAKYISDKELASSICKELLLPESKKIVSNPIKKWRKDLKRHFTKEEIQINGQ